MWGLYSDGRRVARKGLGRQREMIPIGRITDSSRRARRVHPSLTAAVVRTSTGCRRTSQDAYPTAAVHRVYYNMEDVPYFTRGRPRSILQLKKYSIDVVRTHRYTWIT